MNGRFIVITDPTVWAPVLYTDSDLAGLLSTAELPVALDANGEPRLELASAVDYLSPILGSGYDVLYLGASRCFYDELAEDLKELSIALKYLYPERKFLMPDLHLFSSGISLLITELFAVLQKEKDASVGVTLAASLATNIAKNVVMRMILLDRSINSRLVFDMRGNWLSGMYAMKARLGGYLIIYSSWRSPACLEYASLMKRGVEFVMTNSISEDLARIASPKLYASYDNGADTLLNSILSKCGSGAARKLSIIREPITTQTAELFGRGLIEVAYRM